MAIGAVTPRKTGTTAVVRRFGHAAVTSATGGEITIVTRPSEAGFSPIDLLYASLSACLALSARIAASERGVLDRLGGIEVKVTGEKSADGSRIERFHIEMNIDADLDDAAKDAIVAAAERLCTVSNTLLGEAAIEVRRMGD